MEGIFENYRQEVAEDFYNQEDKNLKKKHENKDIKEDYNITPLLLEVEDDFLKQEIINSSCYTKLDKNYGIIYTPKGQIDSFFKLENDGLNKNKISPQRLSVIEILKIEGFNQKNVSIDEYKKLLHNYKTLIELPLRDFIEKDFGIKLEDYSIREQVQFVNFLSNRTVNDIKEVKKFLNLGNEDNDKKNRVRSFLSLESGDISGKSILSIGESLKENIELADKLFSEYAKVLNDVDKDVDELVQIFNDVFLDKSIDKLKATNVIFNTAYKLLKKTAIQLKKCPEDKKEDLIDNLITDLNREEKIKKKIINDLKKIIKEQNEIYNDEVINAYLIDTGITKDNLNNEKEDFYLKQDNNIKKLIEGEEQIAKKIDMNRLEEELERLRYTDEFSEETYYMLKNNVSEERAENYRQSFSEDKKINIKKIERILSLQKNLEKQLDEIIYNEESNIFEKDISSNIINKYQEIVNQTKLTREELNKFFAVEKNLSNKELEDITEGILDKAEKFLENYIKKINESEEMDEEEIMKELEQYNTDLVLTGSIWKSVDKNSLSIEDIEGVSFNKISNQEMLKGDNLILSMKEIYEHGIKEILPKTVLISEEQLIDKFANHLDDKDKKSLQEVLKMIKIYAKNYENRPELQEELLDGFISSIINNDNLTDYYLLKKNEEILAFIRYEETKEDNVKYIGSFNVNIDLQKMSVGGALFMESLERETKENEVVGVCDGFSPANIFYVEKAGFIVDKISLEEMEINKFPDFYIRKGKFKKNLEIRR